MLVANRRRAVALSFVVPAGIYPSLFVIALDLPVNSLKLKSRTQAFSGLVVSLMIKYADAVLKGFAISVAVVVSTVVSIFIFHAKVDGSFYSGAVTVGIAVWMYSSYYLDADMLSEREPSSTRKSILED